MPERISIAECGTCRSLPLRLEIDLGSGEQPPEALSRLETLVSWRGQENEVSREARALRCRACGTSYGSFRVKDEGSGCLDTPSDLQRVERRGPHLALEAITEFEDSAAVTRARGLLEASAATVFSDLEPLLSRGPEIGWHALKYSIEALTDAYLIAGDGGSGVDRLMKSADPVVRVEAARDLLRLLRDLSASRDWDDRQVTPILAAAARALFPHAVDRDAILATLAGVLDEPPRLTLHFASGSYHSWNTHHTAFRVLCGATAWGFDLSVALRALVGLLAAPSEVGTAREIARPLLDFAGRSRDRAALVLAELARQGVDASNPRVEELVRALSATQRA